MYDERAFYEWLTRAKQKTSASAGKAAAFLAAGTNSGVDVDNDDATSAWLLSLRSPYTRADYARALALYREFAKAAPASTPPAAAPRPVETQPAPAPAPKPSDAPTRPVAPVPPAFGPVPPAFGAAPLTSPRTAKDDLPPAFVAFIEGRYAAQTAPLYLRHVANLLSRGVHEDAPTIESEVDALSPGTRRGYMAAWRAWLSWRQATLKAPLSNDAIWLLQRLAEAGATIPQMIALKRCHVGKRWIDDPLSNNPSDKLGVEIIGHARVAIDTLFANTEDEDAPLFGSTLTADEIRKALKTDVPDPALPDVDVETETNPNASREALGWFVPIPDDALPGESSFDYQLRTGCDPNAVSVLPPEPE